MKKITNYNPTCQANVRGGLHGETLGIGVQLFCLKGVANTKCAFLRLGFLEKLSDGSERRAPRFVLEVNDEA